MNLMAVLLSALSATLFALAFWKPRSLHRLQGHRFTMFSRSKSLSDKEHVQRVIQDIRAGHIPSAVLTGADPSLPMHVVRLLQVCADSGAQVVPALQVLHKSLAARERLHRQVTAEISAPKATALLLAGLPLFAWWLGSLLGAAPLVWLLSTGWGRVALITGVAMEIAGVWFIFNMARNVQAQA